MKVLFKSLGIFVLVLFLFYIIGSLCAADFNIKNWHHSGRIFCFSTGGIIAFALCGIFYDNDDL